MIAPYTYRVYKVQDNKISEYVGNNINNVFEYVDDNERTNGVVRSQKIVLHDVHPSVTDLNDVLVYVLDTSVFHGLIPHGPECSHVLKQVIFYQVHLFLISKYPVL